MRTSNAPHMPQRVKVTEVRLGAATESTSHRGAFEGRPQRV